MTRYFVAIRDGLEPVADTNLARVMDAGRLHTVEAANKPSAEYTAILLDVLDELRRGQKS